MAHFPQLPGEQRREGHAIGYRLVVALFFVLKKRRGHPLRKRRIDVVLFKIRDRAVNHALPLCAIQFNGLGRGRSDEG